MNTKWRLLLGTSRSRDNNKKFKCVTYVHRLPNWLHTNIFVWLTVLQGLCVLRLWFYA